MKMISHTTQRWERSSKMTLLHFCAIHQGATSISCIGVGISGGSGIFVRQNDEMRELEVDFSIGRMSNLSFVNIASWAPDQVAQWLRGLDDVILPYVHFFLNAGINGKKLLRMTYYDLQQLNIVKVGHQEVILEAIAMLCSLVSIHHELESENVQSIALHLGCKSRSLFNELKSRAKAKSSVVNGNLEDFQKKPSIEVLSDVSDIVSSIKTMVSWLDRPPFDGSDEYIKLRNRYVRHGMDLLHGAQVEDISAGEDRVMKACDTLYGECEKLIQTSRDPLVIQPASLELATIRKKPEDELGMHIQSSYNGVHTIGGVKAESAADTCGKIEEGDEVIQVNYQTVVGWQLAKLVNALKDNKKEVVLTLKKRPKHAQLFGLQGQKRKIPKNLKQSTFPKALRRKSQNSKKGSRPPLKELLSTMPEVPTDPLPESVPETDGDTDNDLDNDNVFGSSLVPPTFPLEEKHRRATVSGASPTVQRPAIRINELASGRPKSYTISSPSSDGSLGSPGSEVASPQNDSAPADKAISPGSTVSSPLSQSDTPRSVTPISDELQQKIELTITVPETTGRESPKRKKAAEAASKEIAGESGKDSPALYRLRRIDSAKRAEMAMAEKKAIEEKDNCTAQSYTVNIVGGVAHKVPCKDPKESAPASPSNLLRKKNHIRWPVGQHRRISCKDLGGGDCQGWLWKKKESGGITRSGKWSKRWFVLKTNNIYYYKTQEDLKAQGFIHLPGFQISPAREIKSKKYAFKAHHSGTTFYFAAERQEDLGKWMNKMGLAAIVYDASHDEQPMAAFRRPSEQSLASNRSDTPVYSESDDDDAISIVSGLSTIPGTPANASPMVSQNNSRDSSRSNSRSGSREDLVETPAAKDELCKLLRGIRNSQIGIDGADVRKKRCNSLAHASRVVIRNSAELARSRKLAALNRELKDKENQVAAIEEFLNYQYVTSERIEEFRQKHPQIVSAAQGIDIDIDVSSTSSISDSESHI